MRKIMLMIVFALTISIAACADPADVYDDPMNRIEDALNAIDLPEETDSDLDLPTTSEAEPVMWDSDNPDVIATDGTVNQPEDEDVTVTLTATVAINEFEDSRDFEVTVLSE